MGRLTAVKYTLQNGDTVFDRFTYTPAGAVAGKRLQLQRLNGGQTATGNLAATFTFDNEGKPSTIGYPAGGPTYTYGYDTSGRLNQMTDQLNNVRVNNLLYGVGNELKQISFFGATETRQFNNMLQMTQLTVTNGGTVFNMTYDYSTNQNVGKVMMQNESVSGEQVRYQYDSLNRLICAYGGTTVGALTSCSTVPSGSTGAKAIITTHLGI